MDEDLLELTVISPGTCRVCGCTEERACPDPLVGGACAWADSLHTLCTACADMSDEPIDDPIWDEWDDLLI